MIDPAQLPKLLYFVDFPPSSHGGGESIMSRLLGEYPPGKIIMLVGSKAMRRISKEGRLACRYALFPVTSKTGPWGIGRLKALADYLLLPLLFFLACRLVLKERIEVILTVAYGHFFIAAAAVSMLVKKPLVVVIHDDWTATASQGFIPCKLPYKTVFRWITRQAAHVYAVSPAMQEWLKEDCGIDAELQPSAVFRYPLNSCARPVSYHCPRIVYTGSLLWSSLEGLEILLKTLRGNLLGKYGVETWTLDLYTNLGPLEIDRLRRKWSDPRVRFYAWVPESELPAVLMSADILFLPMSFDPKMEAMVRTSLPAKTADYLASGKPILVLAPLHSALSRHAMANGFAEVINHPEPEALADGLARILQSAGYRQELSCRAQETFLRYHDLQTQRQHLYERLLSVTRPPCWTP